MHGTLDEFFDARIRTLESRILFRYMQASKNVPDQWCHYLERAGISAIDDENPPEFSDVNLFGKFEMYTLGSRKLVPLCRCTEHHPQLVSLLVIENKAPCLTFVSPSIFESQAQTAGVRMDITRFLSDYVLARRALTNRWMGAVEIETDDKVALLICNYYTPPTVSRVESILAIKRLVYHMGYDHYEFHSHLISLCKKEADHRYYAFHARIIQRSFREAIANPRYSLCKRRLAREFTLFLNI